MTSQPLFHIGPQKAGTTWIYRMLKQHPEIDAPDKDSIHYYDINYHLGDVWYASHFENNPQKKRFDPTPSYIRSPLVAKRIYKDFPNARIALVLRNPIERAFSHYWHEKKKGVIHFEFKDVLKNYDLFSSWLETGFYAEHIERLLEYFPQEQILCQRFEDIASSPEIFIQELCDFYEIDSKFKFRNLEKEINEARPKRNVLGKLYTITNGVNKRSPYWLKPTTTAIHKISTKINRRNQENLQDIDPEVIQQIYAICLPEIERLEKVLDMDLSNWKMYG